MPRIDMKTDFKFEIGQDPEFFIRVFSKAANINKWTDEQRCLQLCLSLPSNAIQWYMTLDNATKEDFELLCEAFLVRFKSKESHMSVFARYAGMQQNGQAVERYIESKVQLGRQLLKSDQDIFDQVVLGLDPDLKHLVQMKDAKTLDEITLDGGSAEGPEANEVPSRGFEDLPSGVFQAVSCRDQG